MSNLSHGQEIVLRHHLAGYPEDVSFEQICFMLEDNHEDVSIWVYFEDWDIQAFISHITKLANAIDEAVIESKNEELNK